MSGLTTSGLSDQQVRQFWDEGYLIVEDLLDPPTYLDPMVADYERRLDALVDELYAAGKLSSKYEDLPFGKRLGRIYAESGKISSLYFDFSLTLRRRVAPDEPCFFPDSVFNILRHPGILDVVESFIGPEIYSNPVQHVRLKPPEHLLEGLTESDRAPGGTFATLWHQDASVVIEEADKTEMITVWVPVFDATEENGCLVLVPNNHKGGLIEHCPAPTGKYLSTKLFDSDRAIPVPMRRGSVLFMTKTTPHCSLPNKSNEVRWSMDLRYNPIGQPTGRPEFPGFVARSRAHPELELREPEKWRQNWMEARQRLASGEYTITKFARTWSGQGCA